MTEYTQCANLSELAEGTCRTVEVAGLEVALFNVAGATFCLENTCLHRGGPLGGGTLDGEVVTCPWHAWQYNVRTGENLFDPAVKIAVYPVVVERNDIKVAV